MKNVNLPREIFFGRSILISSRLPKFKENFQWLTSFSGKNCVIWMIFPIGPKRSLQSNISKMYLLGQTNVFAYSFNRLWQTSSNVFLGSKCFRNFLCGLKNISCNTLELVENTLFWENAFGQFSSCYCGCPNSRNNSQGSTKCFEMFCAR